MPVGDSHGALMDRVYRRQRHFYNFTRRYYLIGRDDLIRRLDLRQGQCAVEIGCGTARNLIAIARRYPGTRLFGLDASSEMLRTAAEAVSRSGLSQRITLVHAYAEDLSPQLFGENEAFACAIFSYSLSMIPDWQRALAAAAASVAPDGRVHLLDFGDFEGLPSWAAALLRWWLRRFHVAPRAELLKALDQVSSRADSEFHVYPGRYAFYWSARALEAQP